LLIVKLHIHIAFPLLSPLICFDGYSPEAP
jgi:hypothetical protein